MNIELRQLSIDNGIAEYNMLQAIDANEYGFTNEVKGMSYEQYKQWLRAQEDYSKSRNLPENFIPQTTYFLYVNNEPVGIARIRHYSADFLEKQGVGNFGYAIAKPYRGREDYISYIHKLLGYVSYIVSVFSIIQGVQLMKTSFLGLTKETLCKKVDCLLCL